MFRLALKLGRTVAELRATMSARELSEWAVFWRREPFGDHALDLRLSTITAAVVNVNRAKGQPATRPEAFVLRYETAAEHQEERRAEVMRRGLALVDKLMAAQEARLGAEREQTDASD